VPEDHKMFCHVHKEFFPIDCPEHPLQFMVDTSKLVVKAETHG
jgi:hypothetical protein